MTVRPPRIQKLNKNSRIFRASDPKNDPRNKFEFRVKYTPLPYRPRLPVLWPQSWVGCAGKLQLLRQKSVLYRKDFRDVGTFAMFICLIPRNRTLVASEKSTPDSLSWQAYKRFSSIFYSNFVSLCE